MQLFLRFFLLSLPCLAIPLSDSSQSQNSTTPIDSPIATVLANISPTTLASNSIRTTAMNTSIAIPLTTSPTTVTYTTTVTVTSSMEEVSWKAPDHYSDLSAYNITGFPVGQRNLAIVTNIPHAAFQVNGLARIANNTSDQDTDNSTSMLQILYPAHSINPGAKPQGGAEFYATPLNIDGAQNVTLTYSVFFPADFNYVLAGKLPGLYGGHGGCSGGYDATDCFSTRLMWRKGGWGELYLYAPKDKQTKALCADPRSVCDTDYGFSIGRGSYTWAAGHWTTVSQTVCLNTPGRQDGSFTLDVNEIRVIDRHDIFYRDVPSCSDSAASSYEFARNALCVHSGSSIGRVLWTIVDGLVAVMRWYNKDQWMHDASNNITTLQTTANAIFPLITPLASETTSVWVASTTATSPIPNKTLCPPLGFVGLFFSTFFGGHEDKYATPRDQFVWFKDFQITYHY